MYFKLNPECIFVVGESGSIICDSFNNKVYHLNKEETDLLIHAEKNNIIKCTDFYNNLENNCLGTYYEKLPYIPKLRNGIITHTDEVEFNFKNFFLELNNECYNECEYCANRILKRSKGCFGCNVFDEKGETLSLKNFYEIIECISNLGCEELYLTGGNLFLVEEKLLKVLDYSKDKFKLIHVIISYKNISKEFIDKLNDYFIDLIIQIDLIDFKKENLFYGENVSYLVLVPENNENLFYETYDCINDVYCVPDFLSLNKSYNSNLNNNFEFTIDSFFHNLEFHPCLGKSIFISSRGNIYPCPMFRTKLWGNVNELNLLKFLQENKHEIYDFWRLNLDYIDGCDRCEFRYSCSDCRVLEEEFTEKVNSKMLCSLSDFHGQ